MMWRKLLQVFVSNNNNNNNNILRFIHKIVRKRSVGVSNRNEIYSMISLFKNCLFVGENRITYPRINFNYEKLAFLFHP